MDKLHWYLIVMENGKERASMYQGRREMNVTMESLLSARRDMGMPDDSLISSVSYLGFMDSGYFKGHE